MTKVIKPSKSQKMMALMEDWMALSLIRNSLSAFFLSETSRIMPVKMRRSLSTTSLTARSMGTRAPFLCRPSNSRPMPMSFFSPLARYLAKY